MAPVIVSFLQAVFFFIRFFIYKRICDTLISDCPSNPFNDQYLSDIETSELICSANQWTGFYVRGRLIAKRLMIKTETAKTTYHGTIQ